MCITCGCSNNSNLTVTHLSSRENQKQAHHHEHILADGTILKHSHDRHVSHPHHSEENNPEIHRKIHRTTLNLEQEILGKNNQIAAQNRAWFQGRKILALNFVSSPGSGKTTLLARTIADLKTKMPIGVIEGDQATVRDADRIRETGCKAIQINTGQGCHLEADAIAKACEELEPPFHSFVAIENVGNLVCPALFDLGEAAKVAILSVTEGEDKPIKYPYMFRVSDVMILTKIDLLPYVQFDVEKCLNYARQVNPNVTIFKVSATTGEGLKIWYDWLAEKYRELGASQFCKNFDPSQSSSLKGEASSSFPPC